MWRLPKLRVKPSTLTITALILIFIGGLMLASVSYQELEDYEEVDPEDLHMTPIVRQRWIWRSRSPMISLIGSILVAIGVLIGVLVLVVVYLEDLI